MKQLKLIVALILICVTSTVLAENRQAPKGTDFHPIVHKIISQGDALVANYSKSNALKTMDGFSSLYFDHYEGEGVELAVMAISPTINVKTETLFTQMVGLAGSSAPKAQLENSWAKLKIRLTDDLALLQSSKASSATEVYAQSTIILLREGFEAMLIITALLAYLRREEAYDKAKVIYYGVGLALVCSGITAYLFAILFKTAGANREAMEGITMLIAAAVLFYVSYWLFSKKEAAKWQQYIQSKMSKAITGGSLFALGFAAFLAVYREGAETILFYQALAIGSQGHTTALILGIITACFGLAVIYWAMQTAAFKIPYRLFFSATAIFLFYMAFFFVGGSMLELQEAGWVGITPILWMPEIPWLGIFPTAQSIMAQLIFLAIAAGGYVVWFFKNNKMKQLALSNG